MKNMLVAGFQEGHGALSFARLETYVQAQIENSLEVGWAVEDILLLANFDYAYLGVKAQRVSLDDLRLRSLKLFAVNSFLRHSPAEEVLWVHDLDAWQNSWFDCPSFRDIGICEYSAYRRPSFAGGSVFYRPTARDLVAAVHSLMNDRKTVDEETAFNQVLDEPASRHRVTILNPTYNMGSMNFAERYVRSRKPIQVCHFHPEDEGCVTTHIHGRNFFRVKTVTGRLEELIRRHFDIRQGKGCTAESDSTKGNGSPWEAMTKI